MIKLILNSLYTTVFLFMLQGINFKIITPFVFNKILKRNRDVSFKDNFLFSISYLINTFFQVAFYGTILVGVCWFFLPFLLFLFAFDYYSMIRSPSKERSLPLTIFSNTIIILICGVFPVTFLGH